ncbi:MAG: TonB-dependent receptor [Steroidobacteraceae bacterium]
MSIEIQKVVRQVLAPMVIVVPCMTLLAAAPRLAAAQATDQSSTQSSTNQPASTKLKQVTIVAAEEAVATVSPTKFEHVSPSTSVVEVLNNVPGFDSETLGVGGFVVSDESYSVDGFFSDELGSTYDGVPFLNTFLGGLFGEGDQPIGQPLVAMDVSGANVYSGASTQSDSSIDDLGGTIGFEPVLPTAHFHVDLGMTGGEYNGGGSETQETFGINSGGISSLNGLDVMAKVQHTLLHGPWQNVVERINSYYLAAVQPTSSGEVKLIALVNAANGQPPTEAPAPIIAQYGYDYNFPMNVSYTNQESQSSFVALSVKSLLSPDMIGEIKAFYNGTNNNRIAWANPIYDNKYDGYEYDLDDTLKSCSALNTYESSSATAPPAGLPETYNCAVATGMFGGPLQGTAYQHYIQNYSELGAQGHLTLLLPDNTVEAGAMGINAPMLSEESWFGAWPSPIGTTGYNMGWLEHDNQTWMQGYLEDNIALLDRKLHIYPGVKYTRLAMFSNDDQGYYYEYSGSVAETYKYLEDSIGVNYAFEPELNAYVDFGQSTKPPNVSALYGNIGASPEPIAPNIVPEKVDNIDAGVRFKNPYYNWQVAFFNRNIHDIFSETYSDVTGITLTKNAGNALYRGFTLGGGVTLPYDLQLTGNLGYTNAKYTTNFTDVSGAEFTNGMPLSHIPELTGTVELAYSNGPWYGSLRDHYRGWEYVENYENGTTCTPSNLSCQTNYRMGGYGTLDLDGAYTWNVDTDTLKSLTLELHVDNLLNRHAPFYSEGLDTSSTPNFLWEIYNTPMFASLSVTASFF